MVKQEEIRKDTRSNLENNDHHFEWPVWNSGLSTLLTVHLVVVVFFLRKKKIDKSRLFLRRCLPQKNDVASVRLLVIIDVCFNPPKFFFWAALDGKSSATQLACCVNLQAYSGAEYNKPQGGFLPGECVPGVHRLHHGVRLMSVGFIFFPFFYSFG